jgi:hypothetical protein
MSSQSSSGAGTPESGIDGLASMAAMVGLPAMGNLPNVKVHKGRDVIFTMPRRYRWPLIQRGAIFALITAVDLLPGRHILLLEAAVWFAGPIALAYLVTYVWRGRFRTTVTPDGIQIRGYLTHFVRWQDVRAIEVRSNGPDRRTDRAIEATGPYQSGLVATSGKMARLAAAYVLRQHGRTLLLRAPLVANWQHDPYFEAKINIIRALMALYTGGSRPG